MKERRSIVSAYEQALNENRPCVLATVISVKGSSYRRPGARMLITDSGEIHGSVSGGCLERDLIRRAQFALTSQKTSLIRYDTTIESDAAIESDATSDAMERFPSIGMGCNGVIEISLEPVLCDKLHPVLGAYRDSILSGIEAEITTTVSNIDGEFCELSYIVQKNGQPPLPVGNLPTLQEKIEPPTPWIIFGAGHDSVPMATIAQELGWHVTVVDCGSAHSVHTRHFRKVDRFIQCRAEEISLKLALRSNSMCIVMTHNYFHDAAILPQLLASPACYIGLLGPKKRSQMILEGLKESTPSALALNQSRIYSPVGLDLGAETPQEIALSVLAEAQIVLKGEALIGRSLRDRSGPIHSRSVL